MPNINFLEKMGRDSRLRHASSDEIAAALVTEKIDPELSSIILSKNQHQLESFLKVNTNVCSIIFPVHDDEEEGSDDKCEPALK